MFLKAILDNYFDLKLSKQLSFEYLYLYLLINSNTLFH